MSYKMFEFLVCDPEYRANFIQRAREGKLNPTLEKMMFEYLLGKPAETLNLNMDNEKSTDVSALTEKEILERKKQIMDKILELRAQMPGTPSPSNGEELN